MITRRAALTGLAALMSPIPAWSATDEELRIAAGSDSLSMSRYPAGGAGRRPAVIALHGSRGIEFRRHAYERYAEALTAGGIDAYLLRYMTPADTAVLTAKSSTPASRGAYDATRFDGWAAAVSAAVTEIQARSDSSGHVGLLGFSLGGYVAAGAAAHDPRIAALAVLYGGMPDAMAANVMHLPPLIVLHGEEDRNVPIAEGRKLVELGKAAGAETEFVPYPGKVHGFDFSDTDPSAQDAIDRVTRFFRKRLPA